MTETISLWIGFNVFILCLLALDLGFFNKKDHQISVKEALGWSGFWIALALLFNLGIYYWKGTEVAMSFLAGYLIEKSLSVDNLFVFLMIFTYFKIEGKYQHKILFWGIIGALIMRAAMIAGGTALINSFHWTLYIFGALLVLTGLKMLFQKEDSEFNPDKSKMVQFFRKIVPTTSEYHKGKLFIKRNGTFMATSLFMVLLIVEASDLLFALDSIPAIFGVTQDPFIVYTSNVFAILGLRSLYFALASFMDKFHYLKTGLSVILVFIGTKMLIAEVYKIPIFLALAVVMSILCISVIASTIIRPVKKSEEIMEKELDYHSR